MFVITCQTLIFKSNNFYVFKYQHVFNVINYLVNINVSYDAICLSVIKQQHKSNNLNILHDISRKVGHLSSDYAYIATLLCLCTGSTVTLGQINQNCKTTYICHCCANRKNSLLVWTHLKLSANTLLYNSGRSVK